MNNEFEQRMAVVTGASSGIGLAVSELLLQRGARVLAMSRSLGGLGALLERYPEQLFWYEGDVTREASLQGLAERAAELGEVHYLVPNAGIAKLAPGSDLQAFDEQWRINGAGAVNTFYALKAQLAQPASVVFISTFLRHLGFVGLGAYIATKAALSSLVRSLALEHANEGLRLNLVSPGPTATPIWNSLGLPDDALASVAGEVNARLVDNEFLSSEAVAEVVLFQLSQGARGVYGQDWVVDKGYTLR
ncbi:SDR family oxidoreductase [Pseudomonas subflava]|uniref:SDR family oxidoreductase n=1 Tax=Pseudomonas subflava TaxID=2952933 RepID=UPI00207A9C0B|nr:SDR family oxidoreductase [Pseudomonas subflava]